MNISNISCEYFYDEEYDVAMGEGSYNQPFINSFNNNTYPFLNEGGKTFNQIYPEFEGNASELWSESAMRQSGNNNYPELCCDPNDTNVYKYVSSDNVMETSNYSLTKNLPFLSQPRGNLCNYHLCYETRRESLTTPITGERFFLNNFDFKRQFARRYNSRTFFDSGKCSAATSDSFIHPVKNYRPNSENDLNETSFEEKRILTSLPNNRKSSKQLWRKLKQSFCNKNLKWKKILNENNRQRLCRSYSSPSLAFESDATKETGKTNRYSTTIVELYNLLNDLAEETTENVFIEKPKPASDVSCQFPELKSPIEVKLIKKKIKDAKLDYPGLGKIKLPHQLRTSSNQLLDYNGILHKLKFLEQISHMPSEKIRRSRSVNRAVDHHRNPHIMIEVDDLPNENNNTNPPFVRCSSESRFKINRSNSARQSSQCPVDRNNNNNQLFIIEENKSLSFADLRPIPQNWGLSKDNDILAMFEFPLRSSNDTKVVEYDEENHIRLGGIVNNAIAAMKIAADGITSTQELTLMCDKFVRCKDSNRQSTSSLILAVDTIIALISDGLSADSMRNKKAPVHTAAGIKMTQRLWMFIEESCRGTLVKDPSQKLAFSNLLKQVKQMCGTTTSATSKSKEWAIQLKLQVFIVLSIRNNLLHVWLKAVVANDTILHRFFNSNSFLRQARTSYSNALSAVVVEARHLSMPTSSRIYNVSKPISAKSRASNGGQSSNSSNDSSLQKSRIPRSTRRPPGLPVK